MESKSVCPTVTAGSMDRVDCLANLPPEIISHILSYLSSEDAVQCLCVSRLWDERIRTQDTFWKRACIEFGLPDYLEEHLLLKKCEPVALFVAARRQRQHISSRTAIVSRLERIREYPLFSGTDRPRSRAASLGNGYIIEVAYEPVPKHPCTRSTRPDGSFVFLGKIDNQKIERVYEILQTFSIPACGETFYQITIVLLQYHQMLSGRSILSHSTPYKAHHSHFQYHIPLAMTLCRPEQKYTLPAHDVQ